MDTKTAENAAGRLDNLDLMKAAGILMVLTLHIPLWNTDFFSVPTISRKVQYAFRLISEGVPVFMAVNGILMFRKPGLDLKRHLMKTLRLFILLLLWCVILTVAGLLLERDPKPVTLYNLVHFTLQTQIGSKYTGVLWFLQGLLAVYLMFPVLKAAYDSKGKLFEYLFIVVFAFTGGISLLEMIRDYAGTYCETSLLTEAIGFFNRFIPLDNRWYFAYFMLGGMIYRYRERIREKRALLTAIGLLSWLAVFAFAYTLSLRLGKVYNEAVNYGSVFMMLFLVGFYAATLPFENRGTLPQRFICSLGRNTLGIFVTHYLFIFLIRRFFTVDTMPQRMLAFVAVLLGSYSLTLLLKRIPGLRLLVTS